MGAKFSVNVGASTDVKKVLSKVSSKFSLSAASAKSLESEITEIKALCARARQMKGIFSTEKELSIAEGKALLKGSEPFRISVLARLNSFY